MKLQNYLAQVCSWKDKLQIKIKNVMCHLIFLFLIIDSIAHQVYIF